MTLSDERIAEIIAEEEAKYLAGEDDARAARLSGLRCFCCDDLLPAGSSGPECASCAQIEA